MRGHFVAASGEKLVGPDSVVPQKSVHAMGIFITRAVVVERECAPKIAREEKRRRQPCRPSANDDAVVRLSDHLPGRVSRSVIYRLSLLCRRFLRPGSRSAAL